MNSTSALGLLFGLLLSAPHDDWPHWRGPDRSGIAPETGWVAAGKALWSAEVGLGYSSPSVAGGRLYTRGFFEADGVDLTLCLDAETGEEVWSHAAPAKLWDNMHGGGTLTTPTVDGEAVYVLSRMGPLFALNAAEGSVLWERKLDAEFGIATDPFGLCSSPVVLGDHVIVNVGKTIAFDKHTGKTVWETKDYAYSYATPAPFTWNERELLAVFNGAGLVVLDRASGKELALFEWTSGYNVNSATPIVAEDLIFISTGYDDKGCALVQLTDEGLAEVWSSKLMCTKMNGCVLVEELLFGFDGSELECLGLDGELRWKERGFGKGAMIVSDGRLIVLSEKGELVIGPASAEGFQPTHREQVFEEGVCWTTPVLAEGLLYLRNSLGQLECRDHRGAR